MYRQQVSQYKRQNIQTSPPGKIIVMLYDGALKNLHRAETAFEQENYEQKTKALNKVQDILLELMNALDLHKGGAIANNLQSLYVYLMQRVMEADLKKNIQAIDEIRNILQELRDAFSTILKQPESAELGR